MKPTEKIPNELVKSTERRTFLKAAIGTAATAAAIPAVSSVASAHFPEALRIDIEPESGDNEIDPNEDNQISVAVLQTTFVDEDGILKDPGTELTFDPTERPERYRFGTQEVLANDGGAKPVGDSEVRDVNGDGNDDLVLQFPLEGTGFTGDETTVTLYWERQGSHEHGFYGTDTISLPNDLEVSDIDILNYALTLEHLEAAYYNDFLNNYSERSCVA